MWFPLRVSDDKYSLCVVCLIMTHSRGSRCQWIPARRSSWSSRRAGWCNGRGGRTHWTRCATLAFGCHWLPRQRCSCQSLGVTEVRKRGEMISMADGTDGKSWKSELHKSFCWGKTDDTLLNQRLPEETKTKVPCCRISLNVSPGAVLPWHRLVLQWSFSSEQVLPS